MFWNWIRTWTFDRWVAVLTLVVNALLLAGLWLTRNQLKLMRDDRLEDQRREREFAEWSGRAGTVVTKIGKFYNLHSKKHNWLAIIQIVFPDDALRQLLEQYLIDASPDNYRGPKPVTSELLRLPLVRKIIEDAEHRLKAIETEDPDVAREAKLIP